MKHLRAIDGLRAIAVLAVMAYHYGLPIPAGFVGVDIFFVISGFLITKLLHDELKRAGRIDFVEFYARRARRILPALVVVVAATLAASALLLSPVEWHQTVQSAAAAFVFVSNLFFNAAPTGYFDPSPDSAPLLHLWSLGVEEQFYLAWPLVLLWTRRSPVRSLSVLAVASFVAAEAMMLSGHAQGAFYQMPARAWELALGGLVALRPMAMPKGSAWAAAAVVVGACFVPLADFPGTGALPVVLATAALIAAIQAGDRCTVLESPPMVAVGLISYSLYLWHWPVLLLGKLLLVPVASLAALSFVLAVISYRFIETPARRNTGKPRQDVGAALAVLVLGVTTAMVLPKMEPVAAPPSIYAMGCDDWIQSATVKPCNFGSANAKHTAVLIGDSVGAQWFPALLPIYTRPEWRLVVLTKSSCPMVDASFYYERIHRQYTECSQWRTRALSQIRAAHPDVLVMGSTYDYPLDEAQWLAGTQRVLALVSPTAGEIRILRSTPIPGRAASEGVGVFASISQAARHFPNVRVVDMNDLVRANGYRDSQHLAAPFAASLSGPLEQRLHAF
ncbi:MAG: acyltransferase family protein [Luteimonas sp.]